MRWHLVSPVHAGTTATAPAVVGTRRHGRRLGLLWNRKPNAQVIQKEFGRLAREAGIVDEVRFYEKAGGPGVAAEPALLDQIASECEVVVVGSAD